MNTQEIQEIINSSGAFDGGEFESEQEIREYFKVENFVAMFNECDETQEELDEVAEHAIMYWRESCHECTHDCTGIHDCVRNQKDDTIEIDFEIVDYLDLDEEELYQHAIIYCDENFEDLNNEYTYRYIDRIIGNDYRGNGGEMHRLFRVQFHAIEAWEENASILEKYDQEFIGRLDRVIETRQEECLVQKGLKMDELVEILDEICQINNVSAEIGDLLDEDEDRPWISINYL